MARFIKTRIEEAFPVLYGHQSRGSQRCGEGPGPFYAPGSASFMAYTDSALAHAEWRAAQLRASGYTVSVEVM